MQKERNEYLNSFLCYYGLVRGQKYATKVHFFPMLQKFTYSHNFLLEQNYLTKFSGMVDDVILGCHV